MGGLKMLDLITTILVITAIVKIVLHVDKYGRG